MAKQIHTLVVDDEARMRDLLIRELSDPPHRVPQELAKQWEHLTPAESSPIIPIDDGFVVFFA